MADGDVKLLYILGRGRGGSTILSNVLGELDGFFSAGEVRTLWEPVVLSGGRCGCGQVVDSCEVWSRAIKDVDPWEASRLQRDVVREHNILTFVSLRNRGRFTAQDALARVMGGVYRSLAEITGARVIVDSSKRPSYGAFLRALPGVSVHYIHLVRDPRASAHSWKQRRHESATSGAEVKQRGALDSTLRWNILNLESELLRISEAPSRFVRLRYEDFVAEPLATTQRLVAFAGERVDLTPFEDPYSVRLGPNHMIAGNPSRYTTGLVKIRDSEEWKRDQSRLDRWVTTLSSVALLGRYGYRFRVAPSMSGENQGART
jgi:hypothetical protein